MRPDRFASVVQSRSVYYMALAIVTALVIVGNRAHHAQQGTYYLWSEPLALQVVRGEGYTYPPAETSADSRFPLHLRAALEAYRTEGRAPEYPAGVPATYPLWGYSMLLAGCMAAGIPPAYGILVLQGLLGLLAVAAVYRAVGLRESLWHIPLLFPWLVHLSVRWPDAIASSLLCILILFVCRACDGGGVRHVAGAALVLAALYHLRGEYLLLPVILLPLLLIHGYRGAEPRRRALAARAVVIVVSGWLLYLPWVAHISEHRLRILPTNGGAVLFISLGQLPANPWNRVYNDTSAYGYVQRHGVRDAMGADADSLLRERFARDLQQHPGAFVRKLLVNGQRAIDGSIDGGEFRFGEDPMNGRHAWHRRLALGLGVFSRVTASLYRWIFRLGEVTLLAFGVLLCARRVDSARCLYAALVGGLLIYKVLVQAFTQYEPRHMMALWVPLVLSLLALGPVLLESARGRAALFRTRA